MNKLNGSAHASVSRCRRQVIDPEFAFYGPMGFDLGALIANLLLAYCAVPGNGQGGDYAEWLLEQVSHTGSNLGGMTYRESRATGTEGKLECFYLSTALKPFQLRGTARCCQSRFG